jgi:hypothetical protein
MFKLLLKFRGVRLRFLFLFLVLFSSNCFYGNDEILMCRQKALEAKLNESRLLEVEFLDLSNRGFGEIDLEGFKLFFKILTERLTELKCLNLCRNNLTNEQKTVLEKIGFFKTGYTWTNLVRSKGRTNGRECDASDQDAFYKFGLVD